MDENHKKLTKSRDRSEANFVAIFGYFRIYGGNQESVVNPWKPKAADTI
jgi:hypothetical protein